MATGTDPSLCGVLVIDKPAGPTSSQVVQAVRRACGVKRAGHAGTLDPAATGVLPILIGRATKVADFLVGSSKEYMVRGRLGLETDSHDLDGRVLRRTTVPDLDEAAVAAVLPRFRGAIDQVPPMFSAVHHEGRRLYELARQGRIVERRPRRIFITRLELECCDIPEFTLRITCSPGTYVRTLVADIGAVLGCGACVTTLRRTSAAGCSIDRAIPLPDALAQLPTAAAHLLVSIEDAVEHLPKLRVQQPATLVRNQPIAPSDAAWVDEPRPGTRYARVVNDADHLIAIVDTGIDRLPETAYYSNVKLRSPVIRWVMKKTSTDIQPA
ncbi:tRNA pseudouridine(55) synthase TruB [bacterium]|nr:tRNA pseudouridine(55) synthase TruB [candidate division CSSED10-310 bacterium]